MIFSSDSWDFCLSFRWTVCWYLLIKFCLYPLISSEFFTVIISYWFNSSYNVYLCSEIMLLLLRFCVPQGCNCRYLNTCSWVLVSNKLKNASLRLFFVLLEGPGMVCSSILLDFTLRFIEFRCIKKISICSYANPEIIRSDVQTSAFNHVLQKPLVCSELKMFHLS